jgi:predicted GIY-YIG superfamily endonuclease
VGDYGAKGEAMRIEAYIKSLKKIDKIQLIERPSVLIEIISDLYPNIELRVSEKNSLYL